MKGLIHPSPGNHHILLLRCSSNSCLELLEGINNLTTKLDFFFTPKFRVPENPSRSSFYPTFFPFSIIRLICTLYFFSTSYELLYWQKTDVVLSNLFHQSVTPLLHLTNVLTSVSIICTSYLMLQHNLYRFVPLIV